MSAPPLTDRAPAPSARRARTGRRHPARPSSARRWLIALLAGLASLAAGSFATMAPASAAPAPAAKLLFDTFNPYGVANQPTAATLITFATPTRITQLATYHWNNGLGARPGVIYLLNAAGGVAAGHYAVGQNGQGGAPDTDWVATLNAVVPAGTYRVVDSDATTMSQNPQSGGRGFVRVWGFTGSAPAPAPTFKPCLVNSGAAADMGPCLARPGTTVMTIQLVRGLHAPLATVVFREDQNNNPCFSCAIVVATLPAGGAATGSLYRFVAPIQLCLSGSGSSWDAFVVDKLGTAQGDIGRVMVDCR